MGEPCRNNPHGYCESKQVIHHKPFQSTLGEPLDDLAAPNPAETMKPARWQFFAIWPQARPSGGAESPRDSAYCRASSVRNGSKVWLAYSANKATAFCVQSSTSRSARAAAAFAAAYPFSDALKRSSCMVRTECRRPCRQSPSQKAQVCWQADHRYEHATPART